MIRTIEPGNVLLQPKRSKIISAQKKVKEFDWTINFANPNSATCNVVGNCSTANLCDPLALSY
jgi:hypothetical protein